MHGVGGLIESAVRLGWCVDLFAIICTRTRAARKNRRNLTISVCTATLFARTHPIRFCPACSLSWRGSPLLGHSFHHLTRFRFNSHRFGWNLLATHARKKLLVLIN